MAGGLGYGTANFGSKKFWEVRCKTGWFKTLFHADCLNTLCAFLNVVITARRHASAAYAVVVSVCLSVTSRCYNESVERRVTQTTPHDPIDSTPCLKKTSHLLTYYNLDIHSSITIIFGTSVAEKIGNQNVLYFPTSPDLCLCTTFGNRKPKNCVFSLKCSMLFTKKQHMKHIKISPGYSWTTLHCQNDRQGAPDRTYDPAVCYPHGHMLYVNQVCHGVGRCVKDGSYSSSSLSERQWTVLMGYLTISTNVDAIKHITDDNFSFRKTAHWCIVRTAQSNCCGAID